MQIDNNTYYFIPTIFDTYRKEYGGSWPRPLAWYDFVVSKQLGVIPYASPHATSDVFSQDSLISDYYRIVDLKLFMVAALQLGVVVDDETPTIPSTMHGRVPFPRGNLLS